MNACHEWRAEERVGTPLMRKLTANPPTSWTHKTTNEQTNERTNEGASADPKNKSKKQASDERRKRERIGYFASFVSVLALSLRLAPLLCVRVVSSWVVSKNGFLCAPQGTGQFKDTDTDDHRERTSTMQPRETSRRLCDMQAPPPLPRSHTPTTLFLLNKSPNTAQ